MPLVFRREPGIRQLWGAFLGSKYNQTVESEIIPSNVIEYDLTVFRADYTRTSIVFC
jgi:hypothetical protein